ncbi:hypothetical protein [Nonomuraea jabiensis]|uniref:hypothetical protein n=1 Tax=Nonomuraea jabiensis TaxID=882448 RepID=UPI003D70C2B4
MRPTQKLIALAATTIATVMSGVLVTAPATATSNAGPPGAEPLSSLVVCSFPPYFPVAGNWDGAGGDGPGALGNAGGEYSWALRNGPNAGQPDYSTFSYGRYAPSGCAVVGNWDGLGGDGPGVVYSNGQTLEWHLRNGPNGGNPDYTVTFL